MEIDVKIKTQGLSFYYQTRPVLEDIHLQIREKTITSISGPSGQGKSSLLTVFNRLWHDIDGASVKGRVWMDFGDGLEDIYSKNYDLPRLRKHVGMVFQIPNPLPMSIYKNMAFPLRLSAQKDKAEGMRQIQKALEQAYLWDEVKDRLHEDARLMSGGQQQRLCIARAMMHDPQILLLDEPTSSLDETAVKQIERLLLDLKKKCTIIMVSHYMDQVRRIADNAFVLSGRKLEPA